MFKNTQKLHTSLCITDAFYTQSMMHNLKTAQVHLKKGTRSWNASNPNSYLAPAWYVPKIKLQSMSLTVSVNQLLVNVIVVPLFFWKVCWGSYCWQLCTKILS